MIIETENHRLEGTPEELAEFYWWLYPEIVPEEKVEPSVWEYSKTSHLPVGTYITPNRDYREDENDSEDGALLFTAGLEYRIEQSFGYDKYTAVIDNEGATHYLSDEFTKEWLE